MEKAKISPPMRVTLFAVGSIFLIQLFRRVDERKP